MGFRLQDYMPGVPNSDPTRFKIYENLPPENCLNGHEPYLVTLEVKAKQYYLEPNIPVTLAEELNQLGTLKRLRK